VLFLGLAAPLLSAPWILFSEIHYHPAADERLEFVEIYNPEAPHVDLGGWELEGEVRFTFPRGTRIDPRSCLVVARDPEAFAERYGYRFIAHRKGDANRSARVERPFDYIERNFIPGRTFADWTDLNAQALQWCDTKNAEFKRHLHATPRELFVTPGANVGDALFQTLVVTPQTTPSDV
jgi:hypothetical protein